MIGINSVMGTEQNVQENQSLIRAIIGGLVAAAVGALLWAAVTVMIEYKIGWMAVGVGVLVGHFVKFFGKGTDTSFGIVGAFFALVGCFAGNTLANCLFLCKKVGISIFHLFDYYYPPVILELSKFTFTPIDILFYAIATVEGYKLSLVKTGKGEQRIEDTQYSDSSPNNPNPEDFVV